jgi:hypothetical protein
VVYLTKFTFFFLYIGGRLETSIPEIKKIPGSAIEAPPGAGTNDLMIIGSAKLT